MNSANKSSPPDNPHYFAGGNLFERILRFFNLLEPGHMVLSLSKLVVYITLGLVVWVFTKHLESLSEMATVISAFGAALGHYGYRRYMQNDDDAYESEADTQVTIGSQE